MSHLEHCTFTDESPQGKQKVYLCFHPDDFDLYFKTIRDDIFKANPGCAIYYDCDTESPYNRNDLLLSLSNMQLFVVVVTRRFLEEPLRVKELDIPFALGQIELSLKIKDEKPRQYHIPVLPITFEGDLYSLFNYNGLFKGMQYLKRYDDDDTTLSFEEKLKRYLDAVLISDEEKKRIQKEFPARIFLSYRKDDRALAQKLMELVHRIKFCRDVAIWYDEYLIPGENWRESVMDELKRSEVFLLNVTEKLLAEGNFVFKEEYPAAINSGRPILPAETEPTDRDKLEFMYNGTEKSVVIADDDIALENGLREKLIKEAKKEELLKENNNPEHLYYVGLAYKNNVGVEYNAKRAVELLNQAGKGGCQYAYYTLGQMYEKGDTVERNEDKAIENYYDFINLQKPHFGTSKDGDLKLLLAYDAIGTIYIRRSELNKAFTLYEELNNLLDNMTSCYGSFQQINLPASYERLGNIKKAQGDFAAAQQYYENAMYERTHLRQIKNIATEEDRKQGDDPQKYNEEHMQYGLAVNYYNLGEVAEQNRDIAGARENYTKANRIFEELSKTIDDPDIQVNLAKTYYKLGETAKAEGKAGAALEYYQKAQQLAENAARNEKNSDAQTLKTVILTGLGQYYRDLGGESNLRKAQVYLKDALKAAENARRLHCPRTEDLFALIYEKLGIVAELLDEPEDALNYYEQNLAVLVQKGAEDSEELDNRRNLSIAYEKIAHVRILMAETLLSDIYIRNGQVVNRDQYDAAHDHLEAAIQYLKKDEVICEDLFEKNKSVKTLRDLSVCYDTFCSAYTDYGSYENAPYRTVQVPSCFEKAVRYCVRSLVIADVLEKNNPGIMELDDVAKSYFRLSGLCEDVAKECTSVAIRHWQKLYTMTGDIAYKNCIAQAKQFQDYVYPLPKGFTQGLDELTERCASDLVKKTADMPLQSQSGNHNIRNTQNNTINNQTPPDPPRPGCLLPLILLAVIVCVVLQVTGKIDFIGWIKNLFNIGTAAVQTSGKLMLCGSIRQKLIYTLISIFK